MENRATGPQIPHWSELPLQRDTKRWQPPPEEKQVNIKLSDCLLLPAVRLAVTHCLRDALDHIPLGVILETSLSLCNSLHSHSIQLSLCHSKFTSSYNAQKMLGHVEGMRRATATWILEHLEILYYGLHLDVRNLIVLMSNKCTTSVCLSESVSVKTPWLPVSHSVCVSLHLAVRSHSLHGFKVQSV